MENKKNTSSFSINNSSMIKTFTEQEFIEYISDNTFNALYVDKLSDDNILSYVEYFDRGILLQYSMSEYLLLKLLEIEYIKVGNLVNLNMATYGNLSQNTIDKYYDYLDKGRLYSYKISYGTMSEEDIVKHLEKGNDHISWDMISTLPLSNEFLENNVKKINWYIYLSTNGISQSIKDKFEDIVEEYISSIKKEEGDEKSLLDQYDDLLDIEISSIDDLLNKFIN